MRVGKAVDAASAVVFEDTDLDEYIDNLND